MAHQTTIQADPPIVPHPASDAVLQSSAVSAGRSKRPLLLAVVLLVAAVPALAIDCPLAYGHHYFRIPGELRNVLETCEPFGDGVGVLVIVMMLYLLDPARRRALPRVLLCSLGAGFLADLIKLPILRWRPRIFVIICPEGNVWATFDRSIPLPDDHTLSSLGYWLPGLNFGSVAQSFPSAHAATAAGLAMALMWLYPRGRVLFPALAVLVACHRIQSEAHFLSDALVGAALGIIVAAFFLRRQQAIASVV